MSGYFRAPREAWPAIVEALPQPWLEEWVELDCAYWANEFRRLEMGISSALPTIHGVRRLSRAWCAERWGWKAWRAGRALRQLDPTGSRQEVDRKSTGTDTAKLHNAEKSDRKSTGSRQEVDTRACIQEKKEEGIRKKITQCIWDLWSTRKATHPAGAPQGEALTKACRQAIDKALKQYTVEDLILVARWAFTAPGYHAALLRGDNPGQTQNCYLSARSLYRPTKLDDKIHQAKCWRDTGSPVGTSAASPKMDAEAAWGIALNRVKRHNRMDPPASQYRPSWTYAEDDPALDAAIRKAVKSAFGSWSGFCNSDERFMKRQFLRAFPRSTA
jgi:hypothetical protein